jgi:ubiquinone/menaquinone biosynthesis C-methylase UbiE
MDYHRQVCNSVKSNLIENATNSLRKSGISYIHLIDMCCGRGGDIFKWDRSKIDKVLAIDNHKDSIDEAINRYKKVSKKIKPRISFVLGDVSKLNKFLDKKVSLITCQFALHYFDLESFLKKVSDNLKEGGYFIGVAPDGDIIDNYLNNETKIENVTLKRASDNSYYINITSSKTTGTSDYFEYRNNPMEEYMVRKDDLLRIANNVGLELCNYSNLGDDEKGNHISKLYFSFVFIQKGLMS